MHWQTGTALLLPRLLAGRRAGPVFLASRKPARAVATADLCPVTGRARLSYRRAAELFELATRPLAHPGATPAELGDLHGWTLHQLRHSMLTHEAENGTSTPTLLARSRHASVRSLERYARPGPEAVARHVAATDPAARRPPARLAWRSHSYGEPQGRRRSEQRLAVGGGNARSPARRPGGRTGLERGLDGGGDELRGLRVDDDVPAEQHAADHLPGVPGRVLRVGGHVSPPS